VFPTPQLGADFRSDFGIDQTGSEAVNPLFDGLFRAIAGFPGWVIAGIPCNKADKGSEQARSQLAPLFSRLWCSLRPLEMQRPRE
jgi:hypothetical protein